MVLFEDMREKRRAWTRTIEKAKSLHWRRFLDEAGEGKLWKAATYLKPRESWGCIPALKLGEREVTDNQEKAKAFMDSFFPIMTPAQEETLAQPLAELPWQSISEIEVYRSLKSAKGSHRTRRRRSPDVNMETPVETSRKPHHSDLRDINRAGISPYTMENC
jgi:hypothetical protein